MKAAANKKVQPKPPAGVDGVAVSRAARTAALAALYVAPENARSGGASAADNHIEELAINIKAFGLLQPLVAYEDEHGRFAVADGGRRLRALQMLADEDVLEKGGEADLAAIPLSLIDQSQARAASLAANTQRVDLGIVEAAEAWSAMALQGLDTPYIARVFGVTERFVDSRLALAGLYQPILEALRAGQINLDIAQLYATAKVARQEQVWKKLGGLKRGQRPQDVRAELRKDTLRAGDDIARFVGEEAYVAAGGVVERELFAAADDSRWLNVDLARQLADEKLAKAKAELEAEGFLFVDAAPEFAYGRYVDGNLGKGRKASSEEKARLAEIKARLKAIGAEEKAIEDACDAREEYGPYTDEEEARIEALGEERIRLNNESSRIEDGMVSFDDAAKKKSGIAVSIDDGALVIKRGVVEPRDRKAVKPGAAKKAAAKKGKNGTAAAEEPKADMTNLTHEALSRIASAQVGHALANNTAVALAALAALLARAVFEELNDHYLGDEALTIKGAGDAGPLLLIDSDHALASDKDHEAGYKRWLVALGKDAKALDAKIAAWPQSDVLDLIAFCVGMSVKVVETNANRDYRDDEARTRLATLGRLAGAKPASYVAGVELLKNFSRPALDRAAAELGVASAGAKTKVALAAMVADRVEQAGWAPPLLRTLTGVEISLPSSASPSRGAGKAGAVKAASPAKADAPKKRGRPPGVKNRQGQAANAKAKKPAKKAATKPQAKAKGK